MVQIGICDDEKWYRDELRAKCQEIWNTNVIYQCFSSGEEVLKNVENLDFLFLDIEMEEIDGIAVKNVLEEQTYDVKIIFTTSHTERMSEAFGRGVIGFLTKPVDEEKLEAIVSKMKSFYFRKSIALEENGKVYTIYPEDIRYIEAQDKYTYVVVKQKKYLVRRTIKEWETILAAYDFCRVNRSYLVNLNIFQRNSDHIVLEESKIIKLSRRNREMIDAQYKEFLRKEAGKLI